MKMHVALPVAVICSLIVGAAIAYSVDQEASLPAKGDWGDVVYQAPGYKIRSFTYKGHECLYTTGGSGTAIECFKQDDERH